MILYYNSILYNSVRLSIYGITTINMVWYYSIAIGTTIILPLIWYNSVICTVIIRMKSPYVIQ